jgi:CxxC-x17-CxxC domain-containing protein
MFDVVCADCGKTTQVPFEPRESRPVYCNDCFAKVRLQQVR